GRLDVVDLAEAATLDDGAAPGHGLLDVTGGVTLGREGAAKVLDVFEERPPPVLGEGVHDAHAHQFGVTDDLVEHPPGRLLRLGQRHADGLTVWAGVAAVPLLRHLDGADRAGGLARDPLAFRRAVTAIGQSVGDDLG